MALFGNFMKLLAVIALVSSLQVLANSEFQWVKLHATEELAWTPCYSGLQCSFLTVPLDYASPATGNASIAIARYPAKCKKSEYRGPLLINPGGPGGSGVDYVVDSGASIATIIGEQYDIVGFDPRGVSYSTPTVYLFETDAERALWSTNTLYPSLNQSADAVAQQWARGQILGQLAVNRNEKNYIQYMTTDNTARDMLRITQAFGYEKLQYWGVSYGSVLGSTFAAMFPDKVGRVVVDGVLDMQAWFSANFTSEMLDTDQVLQTFIDGCAAAGPDACAFHAPTSTEITAKLTALFSSIKVQPIPVITPISYGVVDYTVLRNFVFDAFYTPYALFATLAQSLSDLAKGDAKTLYSVTELPSFECECNTTTPFHANIYEAALAIACGDATPVNDTVVELQALYASERAVSTFADLWGNWRIRCSGWQLHRDDRFKGPFGAPNVSFPLLVIGNTADPVAPLVGAKATAGAFPGSVLLTIDAPGHTSLGAPSTCALGYLREYFQNGTLPAPGTMCQPDDVLFPPTNGTATRGLDAHREELLMAGRTVGQAMRRATARKLV
ncbi:alpha/beta-hydrolase [Mycena rosella]|uniref:Alpha/beta-hydrolase n=1 Tax=Mycena rosella TaxID=1033263 RepID=A0AAD7GLL6_MYCRO|nr:alpha/beta-hydrolase [Mycena rosella]